MEHVRKIRILAVDVDSVEKDDSFPSALAFYIRLSDFPDNVWREIFVNEYEQAWYNLKREVTVEGNRVRVVCAPGEEQGQIDFIKKLIEGTNQNVDRYNAQVDQQVEIEKLHQAKESKVVEEAKDRLKRVRI